MQREFLFTSESVTEGHPDKIADQISDGILDAILAQDTQCRVAVETLLKTGFCVVAGEVTTSCYVEIPEIVRRTVTGIGYVDSSMGFDGNTCGVLVALEKQSQDIAQFLSQRGHTVILSQKAGKYKLYVGPYRVQDEAESALKRISEYDKTGWFAKSQVVKR